MVAQCGPKNHPIRAQNFLTHGQAYFGNFTLMPRFSRNQILFFFLLSSCDFLDISYIDPPTSSDLLDLKTTKN